MAHKEEHPEPFAPRPPSTPEAVSGQTCKKCGASLDEAARFCSRCGSSARTTKLKSKKAALLLAIFLGPWTWLYSYKKDASKFWTGLGVGLVVGLFTYEVAFVAVWIWAIVNVARRDQAFYADLLTPDRFEASQWNARTQNQSPPIASSPSTGTTKKEAKKAAQARAKAIWADFPNLKGIQLRFKEAGLNTWNLESNDQRVWLIEHPPTLFRRPHRFAIGSRSFELRISQRKGGFIRDLVDVETGRIMLTLYGVHYNGKANAYVRSDSLGRIDFPVTGLRLSDSNLTVVTEAGQVLAIARFEGPKFLPNRSRAFINLIVLDGAPETPEMTLLASLAASLLIGYHNHPGGGG